MESNVKNIRQKKNSENALNSVITFKVTKSERELYDLSAELKGISISELVRNTMKNNHKKVKKMVENFKDIDVKKA